MASEAKRQFPTHGDNNDFLAGAPNAPKQKFTARDVLTYLYSEAVEWKEDVDGDCEDGVQRVYVNHHVCIKDGLLEELLFMAGIEKASYDERPLETLQRASNEDDLAATASEEADGTPSRQSQKADQ